MPFISPHTHGFVINDDIGNKLFDDNDLALFTIDIAATTGASGSKQYTGLSGIYNIAAVLLEESDQHSYFTIYGGSYSGTPPDIGYNAATQTVSWSNITGVARFALVGIGDNNASFGMGAYQGGSQSVISHHYTSMVFLGKAAYKHSVLGGSIVADGLGMPVYNISDPFYSNSGFSPSSGLRDILVFIHSAAGSMVLDIQDLGRTFEIVTQLYGDMAADVYCFARYSDTRNKVRVSNNKHGLKVFDASGIPLFDSAYGRRILRKNDIATLTTGKFSHQAKQKPAVAYTVHSNLTGDSAAGAIGNPTPYYVKTPLNSDFSWMMHSPSSDPNAPPEFPTNASKALIIDGADYDGLPLLLKTNSVFR